MMMMMTMMLMNDDGIIEPTLRICKRTLFGAQLDQDIKEIEKVQKEQPNIKIQKTARTGEM